MKLVQASPDFEKMMKHSPDILGCVDREGNIQYVSGACKRILGYETEEVTGKNFLDLVHPDDCFVTSKVLQDVIKDAREDSFSCRFTHKDGHIVLMRFSGSWSEEDGVLYCVGRNVTKQEEMNAILQESEQHYRSLFDNSPDIVFVENKEGLITKANQKFRSTFHLTDEQIVGSTFTSILSAEKGSVNEQSLHYALVGNSQRFDLVLEIDGEKRIYDVEKHPIIIDNKIVRVQTIARDITPIMRSYEIIQQQANKLSTIFESITDAFFALDREWRFTYVNSVFARHEGYSKEELLGKNFWETFPGTLQSLFHNKCLESAKNGVTGHFEETYAYSGMTYEFSIYPSEEGLSVYFVDVTKQRETQRELEKLSLVASKTTNGVVILDKDYKIEWVNDGFNRLTGYTLDEAIGKRPIELLKHEHTDEFLLTSSREKLFKGESVSYEVLNRRKNGEDLWLSLEINPIHGQNGDLLRFVTIQTDITDLKKSEIELEKLSLVASKTNNGVIIADRDWKIEWVNTGFTNMMEYTQQEAIGRKPSELLHNNEADKAAFDLQEEKLLKGESISLDMINTKKSGEEVWVSVDITAIFDEKGDLKGFAEVHTDITALKEKEQELTQLSQDLYRHNKDLQQFTYIVSHNLRAPVANALGLAKLLPKIDKGTEIFDKSLHNLKETVIRLDTVMKDMNQILSIRDSKGSVEQEQVNLKFVVHQAVSNLQEQLEKCGGVLINDTEDYLTVSSNKAYLYSIFYNLLSNAIKYRSEERALEIRIKCLKNQEQGTVISFSDNGTGFDMVRASDDVFKLYKRFHKDKKGRGIGLYLVKTHVEAMDGHVEVKSQEGIGTQFMITLP